MRSLDLESRMVYFELLDIAWDESGLRTEWLLTGEYVAQRIGISRRKFVACWDNIRFKFEEISPGVQSNPRLETERIRARKFSEKQANAAKSKHALSAAALPAGRILALPSQSQSQSEHKEENKEQKILSLLPGDQGPPQFDLDAIYAAYPRKEGKADGLKALRKEVRSVALYERILSASRLFAQEELAFRKSGSKEFRPSPPYFSTWVNARRWEDCDSATPRLLSPQPETAMDRIRLREAQERGFSTHEEREAAAARGFSCRIDEDLAKGQP